MGVCFWGVLFLLSHFLKDSLYSTSLMSHLCHELCLHSRGMIWKLFSMSLSTLASEPYVLELGFIYGSANAPTSFFQSAWFIFGSLHFYSSFRYLRPALRHRLSAHLGTPALHMRAPACKLPFGTWSRRQWWCPAAHVANDSHWRSSWGTWLPPDPALPVPGMWRMRHQWDSLSLLSFSIILPSKQINTTLKIFKF